MAMIGRTRAKGFIDYSIHGEKVKAVTGTQASNHSRTTKSNANRKSGSI